MIKKIQKSLAYRLPVFYKRWLHFKKIRKTVAKDSLDATVITMTGKRIINMTRLSVLSIANTWDKLPKLIIITDGTIATAEVESSLNFWPGELIINDWQLTEQYHSQKKTEQPGTVRQKQRARKKDGRNISLCRTAANSLAR